MPKKIREVVFAEDDKPLRNLMLGILTSNGYKVQGAKDGQEALDLILARDGIDILVTDISMPNIDGYELIDALYVKKYTFPIIICSTQYDSKKIKYKNIDFLPKPYDYNELLRIMKTAK